MFAANRRRPSAATAATNNGAGRPQVGDRKPSMLQTWASKITDKEWRDRLQGAAREGTESDVIKIWRMRAGADSAKEAKSKEEMMEDALLNAIFEAIQCDRSTIITPLIKRKSKIAGRKHGPLEQTALHAAVKKGDSPVIKELLLHSQIIKAIDAGDIYGSTALHEAAKLDRPDIILDLLANRADINSPDGEYITPLHTAVIWGHVSTLKFLIKNGAEVNTRDQYCDSPLHDAVTKAKRDELSAPKPANSNDNMDTVKLLLENGADADVCNAKGETPQELVSNLPTTSSLRQLFDQFQGKPKTWKSFRIPEVKPQCGTKQTKISREFRANIWFYWKCDRIPWLRRVSIYDLVYDNKLQQMEDEYIEFLNKKTGGTNVPNIDRKDIWRWIHFPANNMTWVKDFIWYMISDLESTERKDEIWGFLEKNINERRGENLPGCIRMSHAIDSWKNDVLPTDIISSLPAESAMTSVQTGVKEPESNVSASELGREAWRNITGFPSNRKLSVVLPYIDFETEQYLDRNKEINKKAQYLNMANLEDLYSPFKGLSGHQETQTLDQSYYDMLHIEELQKRDRDQVIYKWFKEWQSRQGSEKAASRYFDKDRKQRRSLFNIWTEASASATAASNVNGRNQVSDEMEFPKRTNVTEREENYPQRNSREEPKDKDDQPGDNRNKTCHLDIKVKQSEAKLLMIHQLWLWKLDESTIITAFPERWHIGHEDSLLDTIRQSGIGLVKSPEELIKHVVFKCATFLDDFKYAGLGVHILDIFESCIATLSDKETACFKKFKQSLEDKSLTKSLAKSINIEIALIYEVKDICDELHLVLRVFQNQNDVLEKFSNIFWPGTSDSAKKYREQFMQDCGIEALIKRANKLVSDAIRTLDALDYLVQTKQAQGSLSEAESAGRLNNYIMLFTIVTVIFTPLSFMTSLFAMNIDVFPHDNNGDVLYSSRWIVARLFEGEMTTFAVIIVFIIIYYSHEFKQWFDRVSNQIILVALAIAWQSSVTAIGFLLAWISTFLLWFNSWKPERHNSDDPV